MFQATKLIGLGALALTLLGVGAEAKMTAVTETGTGTAHSREITEMNSLGDYLDTMGLTDKALSRRNLSVPPIFLSNVPEGWAKGRTVAKKKSLFFRMILPMVLQTNREILIDRGRLQRLLRSGRPFDRWRQKDRHWTRDLARRYRVAAAARNAITFTPVALAELLRRVDAIPVSLTLGQAAYESGYSTSRFATKGNALFGQWTWGEGIRPTGQRGGKGDYRIRRFKTLMASVRAYALNLNTHLAYGEFRMARAQFRKSGKEVCALSLVRTLTQYSEKLTSYVRTLDKIIRANRLTILDSAVLAVGTAIHFRLVRG
jgi:Bax protein